MEHFTSDEVLLHHFLHRLYRSMIGGLSFLAASTQSDLNFPISLISRVVDHPTMFHLQAARRDFRYFAATICFGIYYPCTSIVEIVAAVVADWGW